MGAPERIDSLLLQDADSTLKLLEVQLEEAERVESTARKTLNALRSGSLRNHELAESLLSRAQARRREILRLIDSVSLARHR
jgi:hypothetical protein